MLDLEHDAGDSCGNGKAARLTSVENETTGSTINYTYDAQRVGQRFVQNCITTGL